jgi:1-deoxy-D-xylulose-5-phosphate synthase
MIEYIASKTKKIIIIEEGVSGGGFGSAILEQVERNKIKNLEIMRLALPNEFIEHGSRDQLLRKYNLTADGIAETIKSELF